MATRRWYDENQQPLGLAKITTRASLKPREEQVLLPKSIPRKPLRPKPLNVTHGPTHELSGADRHNDQSTIEGRIELPANPQIVDVAEFTTWPRRDTTASSVTRMHSPSVYSQSSKRQSELSLGILDYYIRAGLHTPVIDASTPSLNAGPDIQTFDFGLLNCHDSLPDSDQTWSSDEPAKSYTSTGASSASTAQQQQQQQQQQQHPARSYSLFPAVAPISSKIFDPSDAGCTSARRKTSDTSSVRCQAYNVTTPQTPTRTAGAGNEPTRNTLYNTNPMRVQSTDRSNVTISSPTAVPCPRTPVPPNDPTLRSRWSVDTIVASPTTTLTPIRTSFGSLLGGGSSGSGKEGRQSRGSRGEEDEKTLFGRRALRRNARRSNRVAGIDVLDGRSEGRIASDKRAGAFQRFLLCCGSSEDQE